MSSDGSRLYAHKGMGLVADVFTARELSHLKGRAAIGHVRYSTYGQSTLENAQPVKVHWQEGEIALAFNGNLVRVSPLRERMLQRGHVFSTRSDAEILLAAYTLGSGLSPRERALQVMEMVSGAYSVVMLTPDSLLVFRDPRGFRPMVLGRVGEGYMVASETTSLDLVDGTYEREIEPGELVVIDADGTRSDRLASSLDRARCVFEYIYFSRPDSVVFSRQVHEVRKAMGRRLAEEQPVAGADVVVPVPDSGLVAALGYAERLGVPFDMGLVRSHYVGRTFIEPEQRIRHFGVKLKLNPVEAVLRDRVVVLVDDSIVRGTTSRKIVEMVRSKGAREVHLRIASPPVRWPCYFGIDTPTRQELPAARLEDADEVARLIGADSVGYLSVEGMLQVLREGAEGGERGDDGFCVACFTGDYPVDVDIS